MQRPVIGIVVDNRDNTADSGRYELSIAYSRLVAEAGGLPLLLPHEVELAGSYVRMCHGLMLTGGVDPRTEPFGEPTHPAARPVDPRRQAFDLALLEHATRSRSRPAVLGVCLGMQMMALHAGGRLHQFLPDILDHTDADAHVDHRRHAVTLCTDDSVLNGSECKGATGMVVSHHRQAVADAGSMRVVARAADGIIEAIDAPDAAGVPGRFYLGVQWHPERGDDGPFNRGLIDRFVSACRHATGSPPA